MLVLSAFEYDQNAIGFFSPTATVRLHNQMAFFSLKTLSTLSAARLKTATVDLEGRPEP
jgi:hypothetical protein